MDDLDTEKTIEILLYIDYDELGFTDLEERVSFSKATLNKYLKRMEQKEIIEKELNEKGNIIYQTDLADNVDIERLRRLFMKKKEVETKISNFDLEKLTEELVDK